MDSHASLYKPPEKERRKNTEDNMVGKKRILDLLNRATLCIGRTISTGVHRLDTGVHANYSFLTMYPDTKSYA